MQNNIQNISDGSMISAITATSVTDRQDGALEEDGMLFFCGRRRKKPPTSKEDVRVGGDAVHGSRILRMGPPLTFDHPKWCKIPWPFHENILHSTASSSSFSASRTCQYLRCLHPLLPPLRDVMRPLPSVAPATSPGIPFYMCRWWSLNNPEPIIGLCSQLSSTVDKWRHPHRHAVLTPHSTTVISCHHSLRFLSSLSGPILAAK
jgi:hypothetical protein